MQKRMLGMALAAVAWAGLGASTVPESARDLPRLADVDVVVVGGTVAGVHAAAAAKAAGASVFLVAPRFQLGEELVTTRSLWLDPRDEAQDDPFVLDLFSSSRTCAYSYTYSRAPNAAHADSGLTLLKDGSAASAALESVQFDGAVAIAANLSSDAGELHEIRLSAYRRASSGGFVTGDVAVETSSDGTSWSPLPGTLTVVNEALAGQSDTLDVLAFRPSVQVAPAHLRITCSCASGYSRQLLGELALVTANATPQPTRPLLVAKALDRVLTDADVPFLAGAPVSGVLRDASGRIAGVAVANRNGRQAVRAKVVVDATEWSAATRAAGVSLVSAADATRFSRVVVCEEGGLDALRTREGWRVEEKLSPLARVSVSPADLKGDGAPDSFAAKTYVVSREFAFAAYAYADWLEVERQMRDATWCASLAEASEKCAFVPPDRIAGRVSGAAEWPGADALPLDALRPAGVEGLYVLGPCADLPRADASRLQMVGVETLLGRRVGAAAAAEAASTVLAGAVGCGEAVAAGTAQVRERLTRPLNVGADDGATVRSAGAALPVLADADVLVVGGGTAGVPAALAAAGEGRRVVVAEILYCLGGVPVDNRIGRFYHGNRRGFAATATAQAKAHGWMLYASSADWQRQACAQAGADVWFGAFAEGVVTDGTDAEGRSRVAGVVLVLPDGTRGVVRARATVDATGNADLTAAAGGATTFLDGPEFAAQGAGASNIQLGSSYLNTDIGFLNDADAGDMSHFMLRSRLGLSSSWTQPSFPSTGSRERRRIVGDVTVTELDVLRGRTWTDTVMHGRSNFDMHGFSTSPMFMLYEHPAGDIAADLPLRALLPAGLEGILATGLGISATRDAMPIIRMQPDVMNQGWAAGLAAAAASAGGASIRAVDVKALQRALVAADMLDARVLTDADGGAVPESELDAAVAALTVDYHGLESILAADAAVARPKLRAAYAAATSTNRRKALGTSLALLGDATAVDYLLSLFPDQGWDTGFEFRGMGNYGRQTSGLDGTLYALSRTRDPRVLPLLGSLGAALAGADGTVRTLSHFRMYNLAVREYPLAALAAPLTGAVAHASGTLLGNAFDGPVAASYAEEAANAERTAAIRELNLAETLLRLGDPGGAGRRSLESFARDPRASYAEWARKLLAGDIPAPIADVDAVWNATDASGSWSDAANWQGGVVPAGGTSTATFTGLQAGARQFVEVPTEGVTVGSLALRDGANRTFAGGGLSLLAPEAVLDVLGGTTTFLDAFAAQTLEKNGAGAVTFAGPVSVTSKLTVDDGVVRLDNGNSVRALSGAFEVAEGDDVWLTHLGCPEADVAALEDRARIRVRLVRRSTGKTAAAVLFTRRTRGQARGGYRYLRLGAPFRLEPGPYQLQVSDRGTSSRALVVGLEPQPALHRLRVDGRLDLASPFTSAVALTGTGVVAAVADQPVTLQLDARSGSFAFEGTLGEAVDAGPLGLVKTGDATAALHGVQGLRDGVSALRGVLELDSPAALDPGAPIQFCSRDASVGAKGTVAFSAAEAVVTNPVICGRMYGYNALGNGFRAWGGHRVALRDTEVTAGDSVVNEGGVDGMLSLVPDYSADAETRVDMTDVELPYLDFTVQVNGEANKARGLNASEIRGISAPDELRKFTVLNVVSNSVGGRVTLADSSVHVGWLDFTGPYVGFNLTTGATLVANNVRFPNANAVQHSNADILVDGGARLVVDGVPTTAGWNTTNTVLRFDDAVLQLKSDHAGDFLALSAENPSCEILPGGLTLDLAAADVAATNSWPYRSLRIRHPLTSPAAGVPGPLTVLGGDPSGPSNGGEVKLAAPMSFNGPVAVKGGSLVCDFKAAPALETILAPGLDLVLDGGAFLLQSDASGKSETFGTVTNAAASPARVDIADGCTVRASALTGAGGFAVTGGTLALELSAVRSAPLDGPLALDGTTLAVSTESVEVAPAPVPDGGFEPKTALPEHKDNNTGSLDKRASRDAGWFPANLPGWTFDRSDNVGVARTGSYFTEVASDGVTCLFLRGTSGTVRQSFTVASPARYSLVFDWKSRVYNGTTYHARIAVTCDGAVVHTTEDVQKADGWVTTTVDLGVLGPGAHEIGFGSVVAGGDALVDNVRLGHEARVSPADLARLLPADLELDLRGGAQVRLDFEGRVPVGAVRVDGAKRYGVFSSATMPAVFSGTGSLVCQPTSTVIILR